VEKKLKIDLQALDQEALDNEFLRVNNAYLQASRGHILDYMNDPVFISARKELHHMLDELRRRRSLETGRTP